MAVILPIACGAALGALSRHFMANGLMKILPSTSFPWGVLLVNVLGCFLLGALVEIFALKGHPPQEFRTFLTVGFLSSFTTFSAFALDFALLSQRGEMLQAMLYLIASTTLAIAALFLGMWLVQTLL